MSPSDRQPVCETALDALIGAITAAARALEHSPDDELDEASFGRFAVADADWHWELKTRRWYVSERPSMIRTADSLERRLRMIIPAWEKAVKQYAEYDKTERS